MKTLFELNSDKIEEFNSNYSRFHPTINQLTITFDMADKLAEKTGIEVLLIRHIYIQAIINRQIESKQFQYEGEYFLPAYRLTITLKTRDFIRKEFLKLLQDPTQIDDLMKAVIEVQEYYIKKYALRDPNAENLFEDN